MITALPASQRVAVPWKNGGGVTREVAVSPPGRSMDDFDWRVSMAEVTQAGPFSRFDGIDRHLTILRGKLRLDFSNRSVTLGPLDSLAFSGSEAVVGMPLEPVLDLNVMTRRGKATATVCPVEGDVQLASRPALLIDLQSLDAIHIEGEIRMAGVAPSILIEFG